jgi:hypothetical protein
MNKRRIRTLIFYFFTAILIYFLAGCESHSVKPPEEEIPIGTYGQGSISFNADSTIGYFNVTGKYKPSDQWTADTASQGAGGFIKDTTLFNNKIQMLLTGYLQKQDSINLKQYLIVIGLCDSSTVPRTGVYYFSKNNVGSQGRNNYIYFVRTDSSHFYEIFVPKIGILFLTSFNQTERHVQGSFFGTLWGLPPDTLTTLKVTDGLFDLYLADKFFNY